MVGLNDPLSYVAITQETQIQPMEDTVSLAVAGICDLFIKRDKSGDFKGQLNQCSCTKYIVYEAFRICKLVKTKWFIIYLPSLYMVHLFSMMWLVLKKEFSSSMMSHDYTCTLKVDGTD